MQRFIRWGLNNTVAVIILSILVLVAGIFSMQQIRVESFPNISVPALGINITKFGYPAEDIEQKVVKPIEDRLSQMKDIDNYTSSSNENAGTVFIVYPFEQDIDQAKTKVQEELNKLSLPEGTEVKLDKISIINLLVYQAALSSSDSFNLQKVIENEMLPELQKVNGVETATLSGGKEQSWVVEVDPDKAKKVGVTIQSIHDAIQAANYSLPVGKVIEPENSIPVRLSGGIAKLDDLKKLNISSGQAGMAPGQGLPGSTGMGQPTSTVQLSDIATIKSELKQKGITRFNGKSSLILNVTKAETANSPEISDAVKKIVNKYQKQEKFTTVTILDDGKEVTKSINSLINEGLLGTLFTILVIAIFLRNIRATLIAILSLPLSIFASISLLDQFGYTLNMMTLGGLAVAVGRIVDDSIVVIENIFRWKQQNGKEYSGKHLAYHATKEVLKAVTSSTLVTVVVFLPLAFVTGIIGQFFRPFALAVVFSIAVSFLVAFLLIPVLSSKFFRNIKHKEKESRLANWFEKVLRSALRRKAIPVTLSIILLAGSLAMIPRLGFSFLPASIASSVDVKISLPANTKQDQTNRVAQQVEDYIKGLKEVNYSQMSLGLVQEFSGLRAKENEATFTLKLKDGVAVDPVIQKVEKKVTEFVHADFSSGVVEVKEGQQNGPPTGNNVDFKLYSEDLHALEKGSQQVENLLKENSQLKNVTNNMNEVLPKWNMVLNDKGKELQIDINQIRSVVGDYLQGQRIDDYEIGKTKQTLTIAYSKEITSLTALKNIEILTLSGNKKLGDIVTITEAKMPVTIQHDKGRNYAEITANIKSTDTQKVTQDVTNKVKNLKLPTGVTYETAGGFADITEGFQSMGIAMGVAIGLVFLILSVTFGGVATPLIILSSLLFVPIGSITGLLLTGQTLSMSAMIGFLMLIGIVVTNAVVLLDRIETNRKSGMELVEAIVEGAKTRLRPILMTAFATIFALLPLALSASSSELISKGLAVTVIGGLTTSTLLTLIFVPVVYAIFRKRNKEREVV
jgi:multidrug efflux pump subunit AcrB